MNTIVISCIVLLAIILLICICWKKASQDKAIVVTGLNKRVISGGAGLVIPFFEEAHRISLENIKVEVKTEDSLDIDGVPVCTDGVVLVKIKSDREHILQAMEQFYTGREKETVDVIRSTVQDVLEGKIREIVSRMSIKDLYSNRQLFGDEVEAVAKEDLEKMGLEIKTFTIRDIDDHNDYLKSLGVKQIAQVKKEAAIAQAEADREEMEKTSEAQRKGAEAKLLAETAVAFAEKEKELKVQAYKEEQKRAEAKADLAYEIEENRVRKEVIETEKAALLLEEQRQTEVARQQAMRKEQELEATIKKQAEAEKFKAEKQAEAEKFKIQQEAEAKAAEIKALGEAEAEAIRATGQAKAEAMKAEAEAMKEKAEAYKQYGEAAIIEIIAEKMPEIAKHMAEPLSKTEKMVIIDNGGEGGAKKLTQNVAGMMTTVPEVVQSLTGVDLVKVMKGLGDKLSGADGSETLNVDELEKLAEQLGINPELIKNYIIDNK